MILSKTQELARFLLDKAKQIDFIEPSLGLQRSDTQGLRERILELTQREAKELGIGKGTLHYLRRRAKSDYPFTVCSKVRKRLDSAVLLSDKRLSIRLSWAQKRAMPS